MYHDYMPAKLHAASDDWWLNYVKEMIARSGTFFDQEAVEAYNESSGDGGRMEMFSNPQTRSLCKAASSRGTSTYISRDAGA